MSQIVLNPTEDANNYDNMFYSGSPGSNYHTHTLEVGIEYGETVTIKFDLSSIPGGSIIDSVTFSIYPTVQDAGYTIYARRILAANSDWDTNACTWTNRKAGTAWAGSGGCQTVGTDTSNTIMGTFSGLTLSQYNDISFDVTEFTSMWTNNYGFQLGYSTGAGRFIADSFSDTHPEKLTINYHASGGAGAVTSNRNLLGVGI